ncbi:hypothetical protein FA95DRAFT_168251 [Auriscalpium vulgare]|uniref:Uncharacterized protein n=1 Tax=Auriscalpium vulgare TaxID=40419 RepID=A0ACB8RMN6_9AGAM|nr:hypothetical protein FA95DRAFT_168251 [Auriscalpium vulgare]
MDCPTSLYHFVPLQSHLHITYQLLRFICVAHLTHSVAIPSSHYPLHWLALASLASYHASGYFDYLRLIHTTCDFGRYDPLIMIMNVCLAIDACMIVGVPLLARIPVIDID